MPCSCGFFLDQRRLKCSRTSHVQTVATPDSTTNVQAAIPTAGDLRLRYMTTTAAIQQKGLSTAQSTGGATALVDRNNLAR
jgi:hypothetical protein